MSKGEKQRSFENLSVVPQTIGGIPLDGYDLRELGLRLIASRQMRLTGPFATGSLSFPRYLIRENEIFRALIDPLAEAGRLNVLDRVPRGCGSSGGNVVLNFKEDETVRALLSGIPNEILRHITAYYLRHAGQVNKVDILPNTSTSGLKGILVVLNTNRETGQAMAGLNWSLGRGSRVITLPDYVDAETFVETGDSLLEYVFQIGIRTGGAVKYITFYYDTNDNRVYMMIGAGPTDKQKNTINKLLSKAVNPAEIKEIVERAGILGIQVRDEVTKAVLKYFPWQRGAEQVLDVPYINADIDSMTIFSGGVLGDNNGLAPFTIGVEEMLIHKPGGNLVTPLGLKIAPPESSTRILPRGAQIKSLNSLTGLVPEGDIDLIRLLNDPYHLSSLAIGYHDTMIIR